MTYMLCRNHVKNFAQWRDVFRSHEQAHQAAGLVLRNIWQSMDDPNSVFFIFHVESVDRAKAFISTPEAATAGKLSGVIDGEYHFIIDSKGYEA